jgi:hypothetical protein
MYFLFRADMKDQTGDPLPSLPSFSPSISPCIGRSLKPPLLA